MKSAKQEVRATLDGLPDDASSEDIQYHICICQKFSVDSTPGPRAGP